MASSYPIEVRDRVMDHLKEHYQLNAKDQEEICKQSVKDFGLFSNVGGGRDQIWQKVSAHDFYHEPGGKYGIAKFY